MDDIKHIALILDGNRRWAKNNNLPTLEGHKKGGETLEKIVKDANNLGLNFLSAFVFSTENWNRSETEVTYLMKLFKTFFRKIKNNKDHNIKIKFFSSRKTLNKLFIKMIDEVEEATKNNTGLQLNLCFNYGSRLEIIEATKNIIDDIENKKLKKEDLTEEIFSNYLYSKNVPDPDIVVRTSGEMRLSNFLLWQSSYSELFFIKKYWPDFTIDDLKEIIEEFKRRNRRFGGA